MGVLFIFCQESGGQLQKFSIEKRRPLSLPTACDELTTWWVESGGVAAPARPLAASVGVVVLTVASSPGDDVFAVCKTSLSLVVWFGDVEGKCFRLLGVTRARGWQLSSSTSSTSMSSTLTSVNSMTSLFQPTHTLGTVIVIIFFTDSKGSLPHGLWLFWH